MINTLLLLLNLVSMGDSTELITPLQKFEYAVSLAAEGNNEAAAQLYQSISPNDTSYLEAMTRLMQVQVELGQDDSAIVLGEKIRHLPSKFKADIHITLGNAYAHTSQFEKALEIYQAGLRQFPYNYTLLYNVGFTYTKMQEYATSLPYFQKSARLNPYYANTHVMLGYLAMLQGHRTQAMLSYLTSLALNADNNGILVFVENLASNSARNFGSVPVFTSNTTFQHEDDLMASKAALDPRFQSQVAFNASLVKQTELFQSKLVYQEHTGDFWMDFYGPFFTQVQRAGLTPAVLYYILQSVNNEDIDEWLEKHSDELDQWIDLANTYLLTNRIQDTATVMGIQDRYSYWYTDHAVSAIGNEDDAENYVGPWVFFGENGQLTSTGMYNDAGQKTGTWKYYYEDGTLAREEQYDEQGNFTEPARYYHQNGALSIVARFHEQQLNGPLEYFYNCGTLKESVTYQNGQKEGDGFLYYETGQKRLDYHMHEDLLTGEYTFFYKNGVVSDNYHYDNGNLQGDYSNYHNSGARREAGRYELDSANGLWEAWYPNGTPQYKGMYDRNAHVGEWIYYHENGQIKSRINYNNLGELDGLSSYFSESGQLLQKITYAQGKEVAYSCYDSKGNLLAEQANTEGNLPYLDYTKDGHKSAEGTLKDGLLEGDYTTYYHNGFVKNKGTMHEGSYEGLLEEYQETGQLLSKASVKNGLNHGKFESYYLNGQLEQTGNYYENELTGAWTVYYPNGDKKQDWYYTGGLMHGWQNHYALNNQLQYAEKYDMGTLIAFKQYDTLGAETVFAELPYGTGLKYRLSSKGDTLFRAPYTCGMIDGDYDYYGKDHRMNQHYSMKNGMLQGTYTALFPDGKKHITGTFENDEREGSWKWFYEKNGAPESDYQYVKGEKEGTCTEYHFNGKTDSECEYHHDEKAGACRYYDLSGNLQVTKLYDADFGLYAYINVQSGDTIPFKETGAFELKSYFPNGKLAFEQHFTDGTLDGTASRYNQNGRLEESNHFHLGHHEGLHTHYYPSGIKQVEIRYSNDELNGEHVEYFENGKIKRITPYANDQKNGFEKTFNASGKMVDQTLFWNGFEY